MCRDYGGVGTIVSLVSDNLFKSLDKKVRCLKIHI